MRSQPHLPPFDKSGVCAAAIGRVSEASWLQPACAPDLWWLDKQSEAVSEGAPRRAGGGATSATMGPWAMGWSGALFLNAPPLTPPLCTTIEDGRRGHRGGRGGGCARPTSPGSGTPPPRTAPPGLQCVHSHAFSSPPSPGDCAPAPSPLRPHPQHLPPPPHFLHVGCIASGALTGSDRPLTPRSRPLGRPSPTRPPLPGLPPLPPPRPPGHPPLFK